jgi:hypothetical protein
MGIILLVFGIVWDRKVRNPFRLEIRQRENGYTVSISLLEEVSGDPRQDEPTFIVLESGIEVLIKAGSLNI